MALPPIFVISLPEAKTRQKFLEFRLTNLDFFYFAATNADTAKADFQAHREACRLQNVQYPEIANAAAFGCLTSHRRLMRSLLNSDVQRVIVLEDDVYLAKNFALKCEALLALPETAKYDCLYLGANIPHWSAKQLAARKSSAPIIDVEATSDEHPTYGTYGMCLTRSAMVKITNYINRLPVHALEPIDMLLTRMQKLGLLKAGVAHPQLVIPEVRDSAIRESRNFDAFLAERLLDKREYSFVPEFDLYWHIHKQQRDYFTLVDPVTFVRTLAAHNHFFTFIVPAYNAVAWCKRNLKSMAMQTYPFWRAIYIDDASIDQTTEFAQETAKELGIFRRMLFLKPKKNRGQACSRYLGYRHCHPQEVCCMLDGDDWLCDPNTLLYLNRAYKSGYNMTYGQFMCHEGGDVSDQALPRVDYPEDVALAKAYRFYEWRGQHFRTMQASLLCDIPRSALRGPDRRWLRYATDMAESFYCFEKPEAKPMNLGKPVYVYNKDNSKRYPTSYYRPDQLADYKAQVLEYVRRPQQTPT